LKNIELPISTLAYIGDAVYELIIRVAVLNTYKAKSGAIHQKVIKLVNATAQANALTRIETILSEKEKALVKRAANQSVPSARPVDPTDYRLATGFEALLGFLLLENDYERLYEVLSQAEPELQFEKSFLQNN